MRRILFLIGIIFSFVNWCTLLPIHVKNNADDKTEGETHIVQRSCNFRKFVGSNLFDGSRKNCFSPEDIHLLVARREFEIMIPKELPPGLLCDKTVAQILRFFYHGFWLFRRVRDCNKRRIMEKAFYDTLGGFLRYYLIPVSKFSFYASTVELKTVRNVMMLYQKSRVFLNTNGNGWVEPMNNPLTELKCIRIDPIKMTTDQDSGTDDKCCSDLDLSTAPSNGMEVVDDYMLVALPKIEIEDTDGSLSNIWLPFSRKRTFNLKSCKSAYILLKYYRSVSRCYKKKQLPQKCFDRKFRQWFVENVKMHLGDDQFYPGLGGVLNIYENTLVGEPSEETDDDEKPDAGKNLPSLLETHQFDFDDDGEELSGKHVKRALNYNSLYEDLASDQNVTADYGDKNLNDWLLKSNKISVNEDGIKIVNGKRMKCKKKCKKKKPGAGEKASSGKKNTKKPKISDGSESCFSKYWIFGIVEFFLILLVIAIGVLVYIMVWKEGWKKYFKKDVFNIDIKKSATPTVQSEPPKSDPKSDAKKGSKDAKKKPEKAPAKPPPEKKGKK